jgi:uncharacterized surface protein with fasciclin (FAS1) repeats
MNLKSTLLTASLIVAGPGFALAQSMSMSADADPMVGGAAMYPSKNIVQNAVNSKDHTTLVAAVKAAGLVSTLESPGPFTVFAPTNEAFAALPAGTVSTLLEPANKPTLTKILEYHVVSGKYTTADLEDLIAKGNGTAMLPSVAGPDLTFKNDGPNLEVIDAKGNAADVTIENVNQSNGVIQVINKVLLPG